MYARKEMSPMSFEKACRYRLLILLFLSAIATPHRDRSGELAYKASGGGA